IVFVAGLGGAEHMEPAHVAELLRWEMSQRAGDRSATFAVRPISVATEMVHRIERTDGTGTTGLVDVYGYQPKKILDAQQPAPAAALRRVITLALTVLAGIIIWCTAVIRSIGQRRAKSVPQMLQLMFCLLALLVLGTYFLTALYALAAAMIVAGHGSGPRRPPVAPPPAARVVPPVRA